MNACFFCEEKNWKEQMDKVTHTTRLLVLILLSSVLMGASVQVHAEESARPNILIITVDDMSADSIGTFGCQLKGTSPNMDRLAKSSLVFTRAHVQVGNCMPSRNVMWSGLYPHNNRV